MPPSIAATQPGLAGSPPHPPGSVSAITARMDRLPTTRHLWMLVLLISLGGFFEIYDLIFTGCIAHLIAIALPLGPRLAMTVADKIQRKWLIVVPALAVIVFGILFGQMKDPLLLIVLGVLISLAGQTISASHHAYQAELFPTSVRCRANGLVYSASRDGAMMSGLLIAFLLRDFGVVGVFAGITVSMLVVVVAIGVFGPKTNGLRGCESFDHARSSRQKTPARRCKCSP